MIDLLKLFANPAVLVLLSLICGLLLVVAGQRKGRPAKTGTFLLTTGIFILYLLSIAPVSNLLVYSLESRYKPPAKEALSNLDIVVVLGGGFVPSGGFQNKAEASGSTYSRLFNGVEIFKQSGANTLIVSGRPPWPSSESDAEVMKDLALKLGVAPDKIVTESKSRNTMEQAEEVYKILPSNRKNRIGVVTSAIHMFRADKAFRKKFLKDIVMPIPVGYISGLSGLGSGIRKFIPSADNFSLSAAAIHELIGMIWYRLKGAV